MDKPQPTMKIKLNSRKETPPKKAGKVSQPNREDEVFSLNVSSWEEKARAEREMAAANDWKEDEQSFPWVLPDDDSIKDDPKVVVPKKKTAVKMKQYVYSIMFAVILGFSFGVLALQLIQNDLPATEEPEDSLQSTSGTNSAHDNEETADGKKVHFQLFMIQAGKFTKREGAETTVQQLQDKGVPASFIQQKDGYYVFVGTAADKETATALKKMLTAKQIEAFVKEMKWEKEVKNEKTKAVFEKLVALSSLSFSAGGIMDQQEINKLLEEMKTNHDPSLQSAVQALETKDAVNVQQALLHYLAGQNQ